MNETRSQTIDAVRLFCNLLSVLLLLLIGIMSFSLQ